MGSKNALLGGTGGNACKKRKEKRNLGEKSQGIPEGGSIGG